MAYLDSAGNVDPTAIVTTERWQHFHRQQAALVVKGITPTAPTVAVIAGSEKACKGTH